ncbi:MAG: hydroxylase [Desulfobulbaceae bacterium]|nr:hydroxylase [Desulfobulbaceae bacterium]
MKITINTEENTIMGVNEEGEKISASIYSQEGFKLLSSIWLKQEWNQLHWQSFSWLGFQIWQFPEDLLRLQEVIARLKPDVIVETGVNRGGSAIFFASMCRMLGKGRVISVDIHIPLEVRQAVEQSPFSDLITLIEGDSASVEVVDTVQEKIVDREKVFVFLDSNHSKDHVLRELNAYSSMVTPGSYIVATDGIMEDIADTPCGQKDWVTDNPAAAAREFVKKNDEFTIRRPKAMFGNKYIIEELTYWPDAWLYRESGMDRKNGKS